MQRGVALKVPPVLEENIIYNIAWCVYGIKEDKKFSTEVLTFLRLYILKTTSEGSLNYSLNYSGHLLQLNVTK